MMTFTEYLEASNKQKKCIIRPELDEFVVPVKNNKEFILQTKMFADNLLTTNP